MLQATSYYHNARPEIANLIPANVKTILDIGTGQGYFLKLVKEQRGCETWGIEMVEEMAGVAKSNADKIIVGKVEDILDLVPDGYFDCITFNDVLEHTEEPWEILKIIRPKLGKNGIVIASIPNVRYISNLYELMVKKDWEYKSAGILDSTHFRFFTQKSIIRLFENAGYKINMNAGINAIVSWKFRLFNVLTLGIINDTKYLQFICIAQLN